MIEYHRILMNDKVRCEAYRRAIEKTVKPGMRVADVGCGTGVLSMFACAAGAARVYAVEATDVILLAKEAATRNGFSDRIEFVNAASSEISLPEKVDLVISEIFGSFPLEEFVVEYLRDARRRFLKPGGTVLPAGLEIYAAPVAAPEIYSDIDLWSGRPCGFDFAACRSVALNNMYVKTLKPEQVLSRPARIDAFDFNRIEPSRRRNAAGFAVPAGSTVHGFGCWFTALLCEGVELTSSPFEKPTHWQQIFFPLISPLKAGKGCAVRFELSTDTGVLDSMKVCWSAELKDASGTILERVEQENARGYPKPSRKKSIPAGK